MKRAFWGILAMALALPLAAQEQKPAVPKPKLGPELVRLSFLVGSFTTETFIFPNPLIKKGATGKGTSLVKWGLDSMFLIVDEKSQNEFLGNYQGHGLLGYDPQEKRYTLSMFNNYGDRPTYKGDFTGDTLLLEAKVPMPGGFFGQNVMWYREGNKLKLRVLNDMGQGFTPVLEQTYIPSAKTSKETGKK